MPLDKDDLKNWKGVNIQTFALKPPQPDETRLAIYLIDVKTGASKQFRHCNIALSEIVNRQRSMIAYGTKGGKDKVFKVVFKWEKKCEVCGGG